MKLLISIVACLYAVIGFGQTKLISFRSHSGNNANFRTAVENNLFDINNSNFGLPTVNIDSVIMKSNDRIIIIRSKYNPGNKNNRNYFFRDTLTRANASDLFAANSVQSLKAAVQNKYHMAYLERTFFIGFNNKFKRSKQ